jgi:hypothetical protein
MAALVAAIHVLLAENVVKTWMPGIKAGHDEGASVTNFLNRTVVA